MYFIATFKTVVTTFECTALVFVTTMQKGLNLILNTYSPEVQKKKKAECWQTLSMYNFKIF